MSNGSYLTGAKAEIWRKYEGTTKEWIHVEEENTEEERVKFQEMATKSRSGKGRILW